MQLIWHDIVRSENEPGDEYDQSLEDFETVLEFLANEVAQGRIAVKTVAQVMQPSAADAGL